MSEVLEACRTQIRIWGVVFSLAILPIPVLGLSPFQNINSFSIKRFSTAEGLPQEGITGLATTPDGFLWVGTQAGLARFDGISVRIFDKFNTKNFGDHFITALAVSKVGELWIGTQSGIIQRQLDGSFRRWTSEQGLPNDYIRSLWVDDQDRIWIGTHNGGLVFWQQGEFHQITRCKELDQQVVRSLYMDSEGVLWIGTSRGLFRYVDAEMMLVGPDSEFRDSFVRSIVADGSGGLWLGTQGSGLLHFDGLQFNSASQLLGIDESVTLWSILRDQNGALWVGSRGHGLYRLYRDHAQSLTTMDGLSSNSIWSLAEDIDGNLWVGTREGLCQLKKGPIASYSTQHGLLDDFVLSVYWDSSGRLWIGTEGGLNCWEGILPSNLKGRVFLKGYQVRSLLETADGAMLAGTRHGLFRQNGEAFLSLKTADAPGGEVINAMTEDHKGCLWIGSTDGGLVRRCQGRWESLTALLPNPVVRVLHEDAAGAMWVGTEGGLVELQPDGARIFGEPEGLPDAQVFAIHEDTRGVLWIGTKNGVSRIENGQLMGFGQKEGLVLDIVFDILEDDAGYLWFGTRRGLLRVQREIFDRLAAGESTPLKVALYDEADGMLSSECNGATQPSAFRGMDGKLWFATHHGVSAVDIEELDAPHPSPRVIIDEFLVDGQVIKMSPQILLPPGTREVEIRYTAPSFMAPDSLKFRYRLRELNSAWVLAGSRRSVNFTNLGPGRYSFFVQVATRNGSWGPDEAGLSFEIQPRTWQKPGFRLVLGIAVLLALWGLYRLRLAQMARKAGKLAQLVELRTQELRHANSQLERLATTDYLTGIANHRFFRLTLDLEWNRHARGGNLLSLVILDIDDFKAYNDSYGHIEGDRALKLVAQSFAEEIKRPGDLAARYGGEEFVAILTETDLRGALRVAENVRRAVEALKIPHCRSRVAEHLTVSLGVACIQPDADERPETVLNEADEALYMAKNGGRNCVFSARGDALGHQS